MILTLRVKNLSQNSSSNRCDIISAKTLNIHHFTHFKTPTHVHRKKRLSFNYLLIFIPEIISSIKSMNLLYGVILIGQTPNKYCLNQFTEERQCPVKSPNKFKWVKNFIY